MRASLSSQFIGILRERYNKKRVLWAIIGEGNGQKLEIIKYQYFMAKYPKIPKSFGAKYPKIPKSFGVKYPKIRISLWRLSSIALYVLYVVSSTLPCGVIERSSLPERKKSLEESLPNSIQQSRIITT